MVATAASELINVVPVRTRKWNPRRRAFIAAARQQAIELKAPPEAIRCYLKQLDNARTRSIEFRMSFAGWWAWWSEDSRWERRGRRKHDLVMARYGDQGAYAVGNIYCATKQENSADMKFKGMKSKFNAKAFGLKVAAKRIGEGLTLKEVEEITDVGASTLHYIEGGRKPSTPDYFNLAEWLFGVVPPQ